MNALVLMECFVGMRLVCGYADNSISRPKAILAGT